MSETKSRHGARFNGWLIAGYGAVFILFIGGLGIERFQESPIISHDVIPFSLMALIFSTILVQANSASPRIERSDVIKGVACLIGTFACGFVAVKLVPDTQLGMLAIIAAFIAPLLAFVYYLSKVGGAAMAMDENGIAVRRSISSSIDRLPWPDISYFGLKSILYGTDLPIPRFRQAPGQFS
jgi:hypothetical protein